VPFWLTVAFFLLALFVSEGLSKNDEMYLTNSQVSVKGFDSFIWLVAISCVHVYDAPPCILNMFTLCTERAHIVAK
jgi:hypothetical protein